jgi:2-C-methyl-D-erythritol 4-phosphate cytidylyltransferase
MYFIVAAAGGGKRMGLDYPKQFLEVDGKPIFIKTLEVLEENKLVEGIIVVTNEQYISKVKEFCKKYKIDKVVEVVTGGKERQDSIGNALLHIPQNIELVGVQDGVRPFIRDSYITNSYEKLKDNNNLDGVIVGVPVKDTIKVLDEEGKIIETPNRSTLLAAQTPQIFRSEILKKAYEEAKKDKFLGTDDSSLVEKIGGRVEVIIGGYENIKITTPEDLVFLEV